MWSFSPDLHRTMMEMRALSSCSRRTTTLATLATAALTMSSLEIAERTGKRHADVMRDIRVMLHELGAAERSFASSYRDSTGRSLPCFHLPKRESLILVSGYSVPLRAAIVDRWQELEAQQAPTIPNFMDPEAACMAFLVEYRGRKAAEAKAAGEASLKLIAQERVAVLEPMAAVDMLFEQPTRRSHLKPSRFHIRSKISESPTSYDVAGLVDALDYMSAADLSTPATIHQAY